MKKLALVGLAGALAAVGIAAPSVAGGNKYAIGSDTRDCGGGDSVTLNGPLHLWPPNHKFVSEPVTALDGTAGAEETLVITPTSEDVAGGDGGTQHDPDTNASSEDGTIVGTDNGADGKTAALELRSERSGKGTGRVYTIAWKATFDNGTKTCQSGADGQTPFEIDVPHDMGGGADWKN
ncbi:MAG: hypothetical protein JJD92_08000 [Frankiaceae bacterium]|nr:hypothetical protein [Frankiaceae bacterium]